MPVRFTQSCPTCGRRVQIRASLIGYTVACQHCNAEFVAAASLDEGSSATDAPTATDKTSLDPLMVRVEEALQRAEKERATVN
ncbi:MAG: response regulator [Rubripirellula sp.]